MTAITAATETPEIMQDAEFVVIKFDLTKKERIKRAVKAGTIAGGAAFALVLTAGLAARAMNDTETPEED